MTLNALVNSEADLNCLRTDVIHQKYWMRVHYTAYITDGVAVPIKYFLYRMYMFASTKHVKD